MSRPVIVQLVWLLVMPSGCAVVGWLLGRLIRGRQLSTKRSRPSLADGTEFSQSVNKTALSTHVRVQLAFQATYMCVCEVAESRGIRIDGLHHPCIEVVTAGLSTLDASLKDRLAIEHLTTWASGTSPRLPQIPIEEACRLAAGVNAQAIEFFA
jgi:hypothetical protein